MQGFGTYERDNIEQRQVIFLPAGEGKNAFVSTVDVGEAVALLINSQKEPQEISILTGDQAYTHFAVAEMLTDIRSEKILYANPDEETYRRVLAEANVPKVVADYTVPLYRLIQERKVGNPYE